MNTFLGLNINFNKNSTVTITMKEYLEEVIKDFGEDSVSKTTSPAQTGIFVVGENSERLGIAKLDRLHSITSNIIYMSNRVMLDINLSIAFLCTRVSKTTVKFLGS